jgi:hypothetical protein
VRLVRTDGSISKWWVLAFVLGIPAGVTLLLVQAPTVGPWIVGAGVIGGVIAAVMAGAAAIPLIPPPMARATALAVTAAARR